MIGACHAISAEEVVVSLNRIRGATTEGARAIAKKLAKAQKGGYTSAFDGLAPTQGRAEQIIRETIANPVRTAYGQVTIDVYNGAGQGVRINRATNEFETFVEASLATR